MLKCLKYIFKASDKYAAKIIREQVNLDKITLNAANDLSSKGIPADSEMPEAEISDDWLNEFENQARLKSSDEMRLLFGKILSGEITKPGTFSIRTIKLVSQLDNEAAKLFQVLCSSSISMRVGEYMLDARVVSINGDASRNSLQMFGLSFDNLNVLQEYGLIISDYNSHMGYRSCITGDKNTIGTTIFYNDKDYGLVPTDMEKYDKVFRLHGVSFTRSGRELLDIIPKIENKNYTTALFEYFEKNYLQIVEVSIPE